MSLVLDEVTVATGGQIVLDRVSFAFSPGEMVALIGPNGAGKSTIMRVASGLQRPNTGRVTLDGQDLAQFPIPVLAARRAMLTQDHRFDARFSVKELACFGVAAQSGIQERRRLQALVKDVLEEVGLSALVGRDVTTLSGGERQRAHLARVLVQLRWHGNKGYLLLDEPVSAQDIARQGQILSLARAHTGKGGRLGEVTGRQGACLAVLHDLNWAAAFADRIVVIHKGHVYDDGPATQIMTSRMLEDVFGLTGYVPGHHSGTGRPFILPHELVPPGSF